MTKKDITTSDYIFDAVSDEEAARYKLDPVLVKFLMHEPFFSTILRNMGKYKTDQIPTAGVTVKDGTLTLYWNPKFLAGLKPKEVYGLLKHECYHLIFNHCTSRKQDPHTMWNIATDLAINSLIDEDELPDGGFIPGKAFDLSKIEDPEQRAKWEEFSKLIESFPKGQASEWYMEQLRQDENAQQCCEDMSGEGGAGSGIPGGFDDHGKWGESLTEEQRQLLDGKVKQIIGEAVKKSDSSNSWGTVSAETREMLRKMFNNTVDWKKVLQTFVGRRQRANKTSTHRRLNRKYPYIHPGKHRSHTSNLVIYIDQSGSIGSDDIEMFFGALTELSKNVTFTVYFFDTSVDERSKFVWKKGKRNVEAKRTRYGGTCFNCVELHYREISTDYDGYLVLTDGCASKPYPCISQRCWVLLPNYDLYFPADKKDTIVRMDPS
jgi:predicted metal-dependent peptidase